MRLLNRRNGLVCGLVVLMGVGFAFTLTGPPIVWSAHMDSPKVQKRKQQSPDDRFDLQVRDDFFAGMMGDTLRLDRGMKFCEQILAKKPRHAEALVWHGGGLLARASKAYSRNDSVLGDRLWKSGIEEMNKAVVFEPRNMGVKIGRAATLVGLAQSGWDPSDAQSRALLESAVLDYEKVYVWQKAHFDRVPDHSRGELLFGLASGWSILGNDRKAREYLTLILKFCKDTPYEFEARRWIAQKTPVVIQHECSGCHISGSK